MKLMYRLAGAAMIAVLAVSQAFAAEPSLHQVYEAAESGHVAQAQEMMQEVLKAHPNSGKAHYVEAELLSKQHQLSQARTELANAERLSPGLNFADAKSVRELRAALTQTRQVQTAPAYAQPAVAPQSSFPWGLIILVVGGMIVFMIVVARFFGNRNAPTVIANGPAYGGNPYGGGYAGPQPMGSYGGPFQGAPGGGSGILGSLATGAAVGAGVVAGEALMERILDGGHREREVDHYAGPGFGAGDLNLGPDVDVNNDMGGQDFGISDNSSWDDSNFGAGSSDDWS